ncbi:hypothetical protein COPEUT_01141 [Coprococcus eutactus ATCC 27759]|nr:hypothetical protein COPEUT_01141 [Coprococcus eutactus ATCC 27759]
MYTIFTITKYSISSFFSLFFNQLLFALHNVINKMFVTCG